MVWMETQVGGVREMWKRTPPRAGVTIAWLGQAGFALASDKARVIIDPYLSDRLAEKYRGKEFTHERLMPPPITPAELTDVDAVLVTHRHGDHMDPATLPLLAVASAAARFVVPDAEEEAAAVAGVPTDRKLLADAGQRGLQPIAGVTLNVLPAAHETLEVDAFGLHRFLGYVLTIGGVRVYHSGDTIPFDGLADLVRELKPDVALLPVNGRDAARLSRGIAGNFTFDEAVALCRAAGVPHLVPHHFGMFAFNTVERDWVEGRALAESRDGLSISVPSVEHHFVLSGEDHR